MACILLMFLVIFTAVWVRSDELVAARAAAAAQIQTLSADMYE